MIFRCVSLQDAARRFQQSRSRGIAYYTENPDDIAAIEAIMVKDELLAPAPHGLVDTSDLLARFDRVLAFLDISGTRARDAARRFVEVLKGRP